MPHATFRSDNLQNREPLSLHSSIRTLHSRSRLVIVQTYSGRIFICTFNETMLYFCIISIYPPSIYIGEAYLPVQQKVHNHIPQYPGRYSLCRYVSAVFRTCPVGSSSKVTYGRILIDGCQCILSRGNDCLKNQQAMQLAPHTSLESLIVARLDHVAWSCGRRCRDIRGFRHPVPTFSVLLSASQCFSSRMGVPSRLGHIELRDPGVFCARETLTRQSLHSENTIHTASETR